MATSKPVVVFTVTGGFKVHRSRVYVRLKRDFDRFDVKLCSLQQANKPDPVGFSVRMILTHFLF